MLYIGFDLATGPDVTVYQVTARLEGNSTIVGTGRSKDEAIGNMVANNPDFFMVSVRPVTPDTKAGDVLDAL